MHPEPREENVPAEASPGHPLLSSRYKAWLVFVLLVVCTLNFADRAILAVLAQPIKEDLRLTDADIGLLQGLAFAILYSVLGLPLGWLAERVSRKGLIAICVAVWSFMTAACGVASSFIMLLLGRVGVGIGEAGFQPVSSSLLADHFKTNQRASALAIVTLGSPLGFLVGQSVGGWVAAEWSWRAAFFALGVPGLLAALLVWLGLREPPRGLADARVTESSPASPRALFQTLWSKRTFRHLLLASTLTAFTFNAVAQFVLAFYLRGFRLPLAVAGVAFGAVAFASNSLGMLLGGFGFDRLSRRDARWLLWGPALAVLLAAPIYFAAFASARVWVSMGLVGLANLVLITYFAPSGATVQNLAGPRMRAFAAALYYMAAGLVGAGLGPTVLGIASDYFATHAFGSPDFLASCPGGIAPAGASNTLDAACRMAATQGLRYALMSVQVVFVWAALHYLIAARTLKHDLHSGQQ